MKRALRQQIVQADTVTFAWTCVECRKPQGTEVRTVERDGGCRGHGPDEYCYCSSEETYIETRCQFCKAHARVKAG